MDKKGLERRLEAAEKQNLGLLDEIKNLKAQLAEMQDEPEIPDMPFFTPKSDYWTVDTSLLSVEKYNVYCEPCTTLHYNAFHTKKMAQEFAEKCKLIAMMLHCKWHLDRDYVPDWKNCDEGKYFVFYNNSTNAFGVTIRATSDVGYVAFRDAESARKCADWLNEHWRNEHER